MSNRRAPEAQKMIKKFGKMSEQYEARIARQRNAIDRLVRANAIMSAALEDIKADVPNIKDARKLATHALEQEALVLQEGQNDE